jgi:hypothetical protein
VLTAVTVCTHVSSVVLKVAGHKCGILWAHHVGSRGLEDMDEVQLVTCTSNLHELRISIVLVVHTGLYAAESTAANPAVSHWVELTCATGNTCDGLATPHC